MASERRGLFRGQFRALFEAGTVTGLTDGQLLERFATRRDAGSELAFAALVERHGPMVLRACRGVLGDDHEAMDAFQATFLVLARKGGSLWVRDSLGPWLHRVACRAAGRAKQSAARRRASEQKAVAMTEPRNTVDAADRDELAAIIHQEVDRLPERYRAAVVLCDLEGRTCEDAARHLGCPVGTVGSRLARGRDRLRERLTRRGLASGLLAWTGPREPLPPELVNATVAAAVRFVTNQAASQGTAAILALGVIRTMTMTSLWKTAALLIALGASTSGVVTIAGKGAGGTQQKPDDPPQASHATTEVKPGKLNVVINEPGRLEAARNNNVISQIEGQVRIIMLLPEGTRVTKGQLVCELESANLRDDLTNQRIAVQGSEAAFENARLIREVADLALQEYVEGVSPSEQTSAEGGIQLAESGLKKAEERLQLTHSLRELLGKIRSKQGEPTTASDVLAQFELEDRLADAEQAVSRERLSLKINQAKLRLLKISEQKTIKQLEIEIGKAHANESATHSALMREQAKSKHLERQITNCKLYAPNDGHVVYANDSNRGMGGGMAFIEEGATVRERQIIFRVPDLTSLRVAARIPEAIVDQLTPGQSAQIRIDAFHDETVTLTGVVESVAPIPDPPITPSNRGPKVYTTYITIKDGGPRLRPGMSARVEVLVKALDDVLSVPVGAVVQYDKKYHVAVKKPDGGFDVREVKLGAANDKQVEVKEGLKVGEQVALDPLSLLSDEQRRKVTYPPQTKTAEPFKAD